MRYQVALLDGKRTVRKELFANFEAAMAFLDANRDKFRCEFIDLFAMNSWRYRAG